MSFHGVHEKSLNENVQEYEEKTESLQQVSNMTPSHSKTCLESYC